MVKENNPTGDLMFMIFACSDHEGRVKHFNDWLDYYHSELDERLHNFYLKANYVYPRDQLDVDLKRYAKSMLGALVLSATFSVMQPSNAKKVKDAMEEYYEPEDEAEKEANMKGLFTFDDKYKQIYKKRLEGIIDSFI
ncbi:uncharacterized protein LOC115447728 [Manduca sexta]|uniref:uncharacterized protein LOC115447728 n=1 Tax=Manduca sexta TaxID=7130 RepID=UPI0018901E8E|nr:uncharacterized protein LOC115447728 [Manduca sexta]